MCDFELFSEMWSHIPQCISEALNCDFEKGHNYRIKVKVNAIVKLLGVIAELDFITTTIYINKDIRYNL